MTDRNLQAFPASFAASVRDATGLTTTVATAGTPVTVAGALFVQRKNTVAGALAWDPVTGVLTVSGVATGTYDIEAFSGDAIGTSGGIKALQIFRAAGAAGAFVAVGSPARETEPATAVRGSIGSAIAYAVTLGAGDRVSLRADAAANGNTVLFRDVTLRMTKVG